MSASLVYAGPGLLRSGTTLSVNPHLNLQTLVVKTKLTAPDPQDLSDVATRAYVDASISEHGLVAGNDLTLSSTGGSTLQTISLNQDLSLNSVKITGSILTDGSSVVPKSYVDNAVTNLVTTSDLQNSISNFCTNSTLQTTIEPLATRTYVTSFLDQFVSQNALESAVSDLVSTKDLSDSIVNFATIDYVNSMVQSCVSESEFQSSTENLCTKTYVDSATAGYLTQNALDASNSQLTAGILAEIDDKIATAKVGLATEAFVSDATKDFVTSSEVDIVISDFAPKVYVEELVSSLAEESYVDQKTSLLASKTYVTNALEKAVNTVNAYVDKVASSSSVQAASSYTVQYVVPANDDNVISDGNSLIILDPENALSNITVTLPVDVKDGQSITLTSSKDISKYRTINSIANRSFQYGGLADYEDQDFNNYRDYEGPYLRDGKLYLTGGALSDYSPSPEVIDWATNKGKTLAKKQLRKILLPDTLLHHFALSAVRTLQNNTDLPVNDTMRDVSELKRGNNRFASVVKLATDFYTNPNDTISALTEYGLSKTETIKAVDEKLGDVQTLREWGFKRGLNWVASQVANAALTTLPGRLTYYSLFKEFPNADQKTISEARSVINDVERKIVAKFNAEGVSVNEKSALDLATKLVILSFLHPQDTANAILDYAVDNIVPETYSALHKAKKENEEEKVPGGWIGGRKRRFYR
ncbi:unnamed protein product [Sphagnum tenellum]